MKNTKLLFVSVLLFVVFAFTRCTPNQALVPSTNEMLTHSNWEVDYFYDVQDLTADYGGYHLLFSGSGAVAAQKQNETIQGTWNISIDSDNNEILTINFNTSDISLSKFNQQWKLTGKASTTLQFEEAAHSGNSSLLRIRQQ
ncbi:MAG TPA: hypothetical protein VHD35_02440 [Chitinophagaceae bacterium]|nr:hypothetical protein [Chitinophagaceae bacterium]